MKNEIIKHAPLCVKPAIFGLVMSILWYFLRDLICMSETDANKSETLLIVIGGAHAFFAGLSTQKVVEQHYTIARAIRKKDWDTYEDYKDVRIPFVKKMFLFITSMFVLFILVRIPFEDSLNGIMYNFLTSFILIFWWEIATELDDPFNGIWKINKKEIENKMKEEKT